jgi:hypothetical protein
MLAVVIEFLALLVGVLRPRLQLLMGLALRLFTLPSQLVKLSLLVLLGKVATSEADDALVRISMQLLKRVSPRTGMRLHIVIEDAVGTVMMLCPLRWERCVESLVGNPHKVLICNRIDA